MVDAENARERFAMEEVELGEITTPAPVLVDGPPQGPEPPPPPPPPSPHNEDPGGRRK